MNKKENRLETLKMIISSQELCNQEEVLNALAQEGYASSIAYNIDNSDIPQILGTIAGDDTIFIVKKDGTPEEEVIEALREIIPNM